MCGAPCGARVKGVVLSGHPLAGPTGDRHPLAGATNTIEAARLLPPAGAVKDGVFGGGIRDLSCIVPGSGA